MALSFIGKPIALISHSDVRYRGILAGIDAQQSTIQLSNVYSMGTENRRPPAEFIPPVQEPYDYIIFRASEVKDLSVDEPVQQRSVHDDPAVIGASASPAVQPPYAYGAVPPQARPQAQPQPVQSQSQTYPNGGPPQSQTGQPSAAQIPATSANASQTNTPRHSQQSQQHQGRRGNSNSIHTATASLETVERALGDLRVSNNTTNHTAHNNPSGGRGGRRGGGGREHAKEIKVPNTDFDFQSNNAKFDKAAIAKVDGDADPEGETKADGSAEAKSPKTEPAYNPQKSFFDSLSSSTQTPAGGPRGGGGGGRRGGAFGRNRREEERERNYATFGEPGGIGLMGPGQYVGGWGGYGRRSAPGGGPGGRGRRGGIPAGGR